MIFLNLSRIDNFCGGGNVSCVSYYTWYKKYQLSDYSHFYHENRITLNIICHSISPNILSYIFLM